MKPGAPCILHGRGRLKYVAEPTRQQATARMAVLAAAITHWMIETGKLSDFEQWMTDQGQLPPLDEKMRANLDATLAAIHKAGEPDCELRIPGSGRRSEASGRT